MKLKKWPIFAHLLFDYFFLPLRLNMIRFVFIFLALVALVFDLVLFRLCLRKVLRRKRWAYVFWAYAIFTDIILFMVILWGYHWPFYTPDSVSRVPLWLAWWFLLNTIPKILYIPFYLLSKLWKCFLPGSGRWLRWIGGMLGLCIIVVMCKGTFYNSRHFQVKQIEIHSSKIPAAFEGYRIVFFSDVHLGNLVRPEAFLPRFVDEVNALKPDLLLQGGDLVNMYASELQEPYMHILSRLRAKDGVFAVLGNHDMGPYFSKRIQELGLSPEENTRQLCEKMRAMDWKILENTSLQLQRDSVHIGLCGLPYPPLPPRFPDSLTHFDPILATADLDSSQFNLMLCHTPIVWSHPSWREHPAFRKADLMLSGHTHAMQLKLKIGRWQWSPVQWMYPQWSGLYQRDERYLYVNEGLGYVVYPMRIGSRPEITLITLHHSP